MEIINNANFLTEEQQESLNQFVEASDAYYNSDEPLMSDEQFDELKETLLAYNIETIDKIVKNTIQTVDGLVNASEVVTSMISLKKEKFESKASLIEVLKFLNLNLSNYFNQLSYGPKLDGMAVKVIFFNLVSTDTFRRIKLIQTRGGQDITNLLYQHKDFVIKNDEFVGNIIHGELVVSKAVFHEKYSVESDTDYNYSNPRNAIPGILKINVNDLRFIPCTDGISPLLKIKNTVWKTFTEENPIHLLETHHQFFKSDKFPFQTDGIVVGYPAAEQIIKENYPMNLVAIKFKAPTTETEVINIEYTQKKSGNLTPIIIIKPTPLDGSIINKVAGYNYSSLKTLHIGIGSKILITKSGDIIPVVAKVLSRSNNIPMPDVDYQLVGKHLVALNSELSANYKFILGLKLLQIDGIGDTLADQIGQIVKYDIIKLFDSMYKPEIRNILGGGKVWEKFNIFYQTRNLPLDLLINIMQFDRCGKVLSKTFAHIITSKKVDTKGIDNKVLLYVCKGEGFQRIKIAIAELLTYGIKVIKPIDINEDSITFEMTGTPPDKMSKNDFIAKLKVQYPNSVHVTLTKDTKYLFVDDLNSASGKCNKARKYNTEIITYSDALLGKLK